jgi:DNA-3-methyladenine glycosylase I
MYTRCAWCGTDPFYLTYHDEEWGVPVHDDQKLFEMLILEGAQAGLSWLTTLRKRAHYRQVFDNFDPQQVAGYDAARVAELLADPGIVRNRLKVEAAVKNAKGFLAAQDEFGTFADYIWRFVDGRPMQNSWQSLVDISAQTAESQAMSRDLVQRGFKFVGPTICYVFMQAMGMVNDHTVDCFRYEAVKR